LQTSEANDESGGGNMESDAIVNLQKERDTLMSELRVTLKMIELSEHAGSFKTTLSRLRAVVADPCA
jgi:hypothetical protein